jgi:hypothetical protein
MFQMSFFLCAGCEQAFSPKGPYEERLVIYGVLSTKSEKVIVRAHTTYDPPGFDPLVQLDDTPVLNAIVTLTEGDRIYQLRDTTLRRVDKSRYPTDIPAYAHEPLKPEFGKTYRLTVRTVDGATVTAVATVPAEGTMTLMNDFVLNDPARYYDEYVGLVASISQFTRGILLRAYLEYEVLMDGVWITKRVEVPRTVLKLGDGSEKPLYPGLRRRSTPEHEIPSSTRESEVFPGVAFVYAKSEILESHPGSQVKFLNAVFQLVQVEPNLYNYFNIVNGFGDEHSIRLDEPDYTNIQTGLGVFGAFSEQSLKREVVW